jgi:hypothetical protein
MTLVSFSNVLHAEKVSDSNSSANQKSEGILKAGKEYTVFVFENTEGISEAANEFLQEANKNEAFPELLSEYVFVHITAEMIEVEHEIAQLLQQLGQIDLPQKELSQSHQALSHKPDSKAHVPIERESPFLKGKESLHQPAASKASREVFPSLFALARSMHSSVPARPSAARKEDRSDLQALQRKDVSLAPQQATDPSEKATPQELRREREKEGQREQEHKEKEDQQESGQGDQQKKEEEKFHQRKNGKKIAAIAGVQAARGRTRETKSQSQNPGQGIEKSRLTTQSGGPVGSIENVYIRFMALMARILGQAEMEAHQLYLRIKDRTDQIDVLTLLLSKMNSEKGAIDWTNNEEMKALIQKAKAIGVDIPDDKYKWSEEEKKLLKENIQMRKDSMEKITQLERTDMQRYLQEASQCHQARSNVLKLLKEVMDTIIANMRP